MVDGFTSSSALIQFLKALNPQIEIDYMLNYEKKHGLTYNDISNHTSDEYGLIIVPDASMTVRDARIIKANYTADILVLDHHIIENEYYDNQRRTWITRDEAKEIYKEDKTRIEHDCYTNYCLAVNCTDGNYPNPSLSGVGVVQKFIEAYVDTYNSQEEIDEDLKYKFLDLVSLGISADAMDLRSLESRYYVIEGMKERYWNNELINELVERKSEDMKYGRYIISMSWYVAPLINGTIRYGKDEEQLNLFRAMLGEQEEIEYQPRRKHKEDPKPPLQIQTLQKAMARVAENVKSRQDTEVRKFVKEIEEEIQKNKLDKNSVLFVDGTKILSRGTVTGLVANKLATKYMRPVVLMRAKDSFEYGGSCRGYDKGNISSIKDFLTEAGVEVRGHDNAGGVFFKKDKLNEVIDKCNEMMPIENLCTIHTVDWEIPANKLRKDYVQEVAENYAVFGSTVPEPLFAITDLRINASQIQGYGEYNNFIRFVYNGIVFVKKYCNHNDFDNMTLKDRRILGVNKKNLKLNLICQFTLNTWENKISPEIKILDFDCVEDTEANNTKNNDEEDWETQVPVKKQIEEDDTFEW